MMRFLVRMVVFSALVIAPLAAVAGELIELHVEHVRLVPDSIPNQKAMQLKLTPESSASFADFTARHVGETVDLKVDRDVLASPRIVEPISGGTIMVSGAFAVGELERIANRINAAETRVTVATRSE